MHLIFDLDGTIINSRPGILFSLRKAVLHVFPDSHPESLEFTISGPVKQMLERALPDATKEEVEDIEAVFRTLYDKEGWKMTELYPGVMETIKVIREHGIRMYIVTNKPCLPAMGIISKLNLTPFFIEVVCPDSRRPAFREKTESIRYLLEKLGIPGDQAVCIGDTQEDLSAAIATGVPFIGVEYGYGSFRDQKTPVHFVESFPDILREFPRWFRMAPPSVAERNHMVNRDIFEDLFILELANNHWGDIRRGMQIIREFGTVVRYNSVRAGVKLQFRNVDTFIHKDFQNRKDIRYIRKTKDTRLDREDLAALVEAIRRSNCVRVATPFDERSVELCVELGIEIIKIASSDVTDWPLLEQIAKTRKPVLVSTGGTSLIDIDSMVMFFEHRNIPLAINHCVSIYPSEDAELQLNQIDFLKNRYPGHIIGFSTHEYHDWHSSILMAYAKGARTFERHIDIQTDDRPLSPYCSTPQQIAEWFQAFHKAKEMCGAPGTEKAPATKKEIDYLTTLVRGVYAARNLPAGHVLTSEDYYLAIPLQKGQLSCRELLNDQVLARECSKDSPLMVEMVDSLYNRDPLLRLQIYERGI